MIELTETQTADFYHRSYTAIDGLWFMKVEEVYGFDTALEIDCEVWKVVPKIQARMLKNLCKAETKLKALLECFVKKQELEGFLFEIETDEKGQGFVMIVKECPWHNAMIKSGREHLSGKVGTRICATECSVWASEFGDDLVGVIEEQICTGSEVCRFHFSHSVP